MRTPRHLLDAFLHTSPRDPQAALELFADDAVYEVPYLESLGLPWRYRGRNEIGPFLDARRELFPRLAFHDIVIVTGTATCIVAEYQFTSRSAKTARMIHQLIVGRLESADERITLLRESLNLVELALALYPDGLADPRVPSDRDIWPEA